MEQLKNKEHGYTPLTLLWTFHTLIFTVE